MDPTFYKPELTKKQEHYKNNLQSLIHYCLYCQPYDDGDPVWIYGDRTELTELLYDSEIPEKDWANILPHLYCPFCGHENFVPSLDVGLKTKFEIEVDEHLDSVSKKFDKQIKKFEEELEKTPLLAYKNSFAKKIYKELKKPPTSNDTIKGQIF